MLRRRASEGFMTLKDAAISCAVSVLLVGFIYAVMRVAQGCV